MLSVSAVFFQQASADGKWYSASTTKFTGTQGSCGGCGLNMMSSLPNWAVVSAAESMQIPYDCKPCPDCQCATGQGQLDVGGPAGGCGNCFEVKTTGTNPWNATLPNVTFNAVVADSCAHGNNPDWCPQAVGEMNKHGFEFHLNIFDADHVKLGLGDNPTVQFRPIDCPDSVKDAMNQKCCDVWYPGQGCSGVCPTNECPPEPTPSPTPAPTPSFGCDQCRAHGFGDDQCDCGYCGSYGGCGYTCGKVPSQPPLGPKCNKAFSVAV